MRSVRVLLIGAVVAAAVAVPAIAAGGGSATSTPGTPQPPLCQTDAVKQLNLSAAQASAVRSACDTFKTVVAAADRAYARQSRQARGERPRRLVAGAPGAPHGGVGGARQVPGDGARHAGDRAPEPGGPAAASAAVGLPLTSAETPGFGRMGGAASGQGQRRGMGGQARCPYAQS